MAFSCFCCLGVREEEAAPTRPNRLRLGGFFTRLRSRVRGNKGGGNAANVEELRGRVEEEEGLRQLSGIEGSTEIWIHELQEMNSRVASQDEEDVFLEVEQQLDEEEEKESESEEKKNGAPPLVLGGMIAMSHMVILLLHGLFSHVCPLSREIEFLFFGYFVFPLVGDVIPVFELFCYKFCRFVFRSGKVHV